MGSGWPAPWAAARRAAYDYFAGELKEFGYFIFEPELKAFYAVKGLCSMEFFGDTIEF